MVISWILLVAVPFYSVLATVQNSVEVYLVTELTTSELTNISEDDDAASVRNDDSSTNKTSDSFENDYFFATSSYVILTTKEFFWRDKKICVNMLVSLRPERQIDISLIDIGSSKVLAIGRSYVDEHSDPSRRRTWRSIKLNMTLHSLSSTQMKLKLISTTNGYDYTDVWWAIANLRMCDNVEYGMKESTIHLPSSNRRKTGPRTKFQELFLCKIVSSVDSLKSKMFYNNNHEENSDKWDPAPVSTSRRPIPEKLLRISKRSTGSTGSSKRSDCGQTSNNIKNLEVEFCFKVLAGKTSLALVGNIFLSQCPRLFPLYSIIVYDESWGSIIGTTNGSNLPLRSDFELKLCTRYNVQVVTSDQFIFNGSITTFESVPDKVRNLRFNRKFANKVTAVWEPPAKKNGIIRYYNVSIKRTKLIGCEDFRKDSPPDDEKWKIVTVPTASFLHLHPYAEYNVSVTVYTIDAGLQQWQTFRTLQLDIPTSVVNNLEFVNKTHLKWDPPNDCGTITGPVKHTELTVWDVSIEPKEPIFVDQTAHYTYDSMRIKLPGLSPNKKYKICAYVIRDRDKPKNPEKCRCLGNVTLFSFSNTEPIDDRNYIWLVMIPILMICLLFPIFFIWYRRWKRSVPISHSQAVPLDSQNATIPDNLEDSSIRSQDDPADPPYMIPINFRAQTSNLRDVSMAPLCMNIPNNLREQTRDLQNVCVTPLYMKIMNKRREQTSRSQDVPSDHLYTSIPDDSNERTSSLQYVSVAPQYVNISDNSEARSNHMEENMSEPLYLEIIKDQ